MFKFFTDKRWHLWSIGGTILILAATWYQVQLDVRINEWFGEFYDTLQKALTEPNSVSEKDTLPLFVYRNGFILLPRFPVRLSSAIIQKSRFCADLVKDRKAMDQYSLLFRSMLNPLCAIGFIGQNPLVG